jgi:hypothetical protein
MKRDELRKILRMVRGGTMTVAEALRQVPGETFEDLACARVDHDRAERCGFPEVIFCQGKRPADITLIARAILRRSDRLLATRADRAAYLAVKRADRTARYHEVARCVTVERKPPKPQGGKILVICAGTADIPVAEEAKVTAEMFGYRVRTTYDAGVAGIHRLLSDRERIREADCLVVVAGMEGALASVVGGLADSPVIAVPTSVGYGASLGGIAPLLTMLNSCAAGVAVVNIDNGFGAGYLAAKIARGKETR